MSCNAEMRVRCPECKWEGVLPNNLRCPQGHDLTPWEPLMIITLAKYGYLSVDSAIKGITK